MKIKWEVDDTTVVDAKLGGLGKNVLTSNGIHIPNKLSLRKKNTLQFNLSDGRAAEIRVQPQMATQAIVELRVEDRLIVETGKLPVKCPSCKNIVKPNDQYCDSCGKPLPAPESYGRNKHVKQANNAILILAVMYLFFGMVMFFVTRSNDAPLLARLNTMDPAANFPKVINGVTYTVAALREKVLFEPWSLLIINLIMASVMGGLAYWCRRAPLPATLVALAVYLVLNVANALIDPATLVQGIYIKIIVFVFLARGIKAALAQRSDGAQ